VANLTHYGFFHFRGLTATVWHLEESSRGSHLRRRFGDSRFRRCVAVASPLPPPPPYAFPAFGADTGPDYIITVELGGAATISATGQPVYDGVEDTYIGVINTSGGTLTRLNISGAGFFGFDGIGFYGLGTNALDTSSGN
jgi:hypothetical protein